MPFVRIEGRSIAYGVTPESFNPDALAAVFLHGSGGDRSDWRFQLEAPGSNHVAIALELPGHGLSDKPGESDVRKYADWTEAVVDALGLTRVVLVGCSLGSAITQTIAVNPKPWLKGIVLVGAGARLRVMPELLKALLEKSQKALENLGAYCLSGSAPDELKSIIREKYLTADPLLIHGDLSACDKFDMIKQVGSIKLPTSIIVGAQDVLTPVKYSEFLNREIGGSELTVIDRAGHLVMLEQPQAFNAAIQKFLGGLPM